MIPNESEVEVIDKNEVIELCHTIPDENIQIINRYDHCMEFYYEKNLTHSDVVDFLRGVTVSDIHRGPLVDDNSSRKHVLWEFKKNAFGCYCYVKIKIINRKRIILVVSLHEDEKR